MVGLMFTICLLCILALVGFLFAWMVRLASFPETESIQDEQSAKPFDMIEQ
jgi:hypothetical protein